MNSEFCGIEIRGLRKSFVLGERRVEAVRGIDLDLHEPGLCAIMGPSGSGKSTLLHLLGGLDRPDEGTIRVGDSQIDSMNEKDLTAFRRRGLGIVFQQFNLLASMTALQNVSLPGVLDGGNPREIEDRAKSLLDELGLGDRMNHRPDALSGANNNEWRSHGHCSSLHRFSSRTNRPGRWTARPSIASGDCWTSSARHAGS